MKTAVAVLALAVVLFVAGAAAFGQARTTREIAGVYERLATLHYDAGDREVAAQTTVSWWPGAAEDQGPVQAATVTYWSRDYDALVNPAGKGRGAAPESNPSLLFIAANAQFRATHPEALDRNVAVERLDAVIQAYADVLRVDPDHADAAYNYEMVGRLRDLVARSKPTKGARPAVVAEAPAMDGDLPAGATLHGYRGGPPPDVPSEDFKTLTPMSFEEREEADPGQGPAPRRRG